MASIRKILNIDSNRSLTLSSILHNVHINEIFQISPKLNNFDQKVNQVSEDASVNTWLPIHRYDSDSDDDVSDNDVEDFTKVVQYNIPPLELNATSDQDI